MTTKTLTPTPQQAPTGPAAGATPSTLEEGRYLAPPVDIWENEDGLTVVVDLPGVDKKDIDINVDDGVLTIRGRTSYRAPENALHKEFSLLNFHRQFRLTDEVDPSAIRAELRHGVLTLRLPRSEKAKPRKIEVLAG